MARKFSGFTFLLILLSHYVVLSTHATEIFWILPSGTGNWNTASNWSTSTVPSTADTANIDNNGTAAISGGLVDADHILLGASLGGDLLQFGGTVSTRLFDVGANSEYSLSGGSINISQSLRGDGTFDLSTGSGAIIAADNSVIDFSRGTLIGAGNTSFVGGVGSTLFLPLGVLPTDLFSSFDTQGAFFNVSGAVLVVPSGFTLDVASDRPDLIRVEGVLRPEGSPASPVNLTFDEGGVEVATGGVFDLFNRSLTLRTDSSVRGGEIRDGSTLTIGDRVDDDVTFTQTSGSTSVSSVRLGYATSSNANPRGELRMEGGTLSIGGSLSVGTGSSSSTYFSEGVYRQTAGTTTVTNSLLVANRSGTTGEVELLGGTFAVSDDVTIASGLNSDGEWLIDGATVTVGDEVAIGRTDGNMIGNLIQSSGSLTADQVTIYNGSQYDLTGGTLTLNEGFDLTGTLNFGGGNASITVADDAVVEWSTGTLAGSAANTNYSAGVDSESYFPAGFDPLVEFASFNSQGLVHTEGTPLVVPSGFTLDVASDRPDLIRVVGTLRPQGSPANPQSLTFDEGGVEITPTGLFNLFGASLTLRSDMLVDGGEVRNAGTVTIGDATNQTHTFTQTSGMTDINGSLRIGYATSTNSTAQGAMNVEGGTLSIGGSLSVGTGSSSSTYFSEGVYRQTGGTATAANGLFVANRNGTTGAVELLDGSLSIGGNSTVASDSNSDGTLAVGGGTMAIGGDLTVGRSDGNSDGQLTQTAGDLSIDQLTIHNGSRYDLTGGTLTLIEGFDLTGTLNFGGGNASITVADDAVVEWSTGTLTGSAASTHYAAGIDSESYFPAGFDPFSEFASFNSQGLVQSSGTAVVIPPSYTGEVFILNADNIAVAGTLTQAEGGAINAASFTIAGGEFRGDGVVSTDEFTNSGLLEIGTSNQASALSISGIYEQTQLGVFTIDLAGFLPGVSHDQLTVAGETMLDGTIIVSLENGFVPGLASSFEILKTGSLSGMFSTLLVEQPLPTGLAWELVYTPQSVLLNVIESGIAGDFNTDGVVDSADYTVWRDNLGSIDESTIGGLGDGMNGVDQADYLLWRANFGQASAAAGVMSLGTVPEPNSVALILAIYVLAVSERFMRRLR